MINTEVIKQSPMRALERAINGRLGVGKLGLVAARAGVGKTACLVQIGLDALLQGKTVLHVSTEAPVARMRAYYDELLREMERITALDVTANMALDLERRRLLVSQPGDDIKVSRISEALSVAEGALGRKPEILIVEGIDWENVSEDRLTSLRKLAEQAGAELWLSARTHRHEKVTHPDGIPAPIDRFSNSFDTILGLKPQGSRVLLRVLKGQAQQSKDTAELLLDSVTMMLVGTDSDMKKIESQRRHKFLLHSGGAKGAEATFGEMAERYGIRETTLSFENHPGRVRSRGLHLLTDDDLLLGDVSLRYVSHRLSRTFPQQETIRRILQSIWHQVHPCDQVFVIGIIQDDNTVRGGTGWGAELARRWNKELYVFDQEKNGWFQWQGDKWVEATPIIRSPLFCGTGTRRLQENGRAAIEQLFEQSFNSSSVS